MKKYTYTFKAKGTMRLVGEGVAQGADLDEAMADAFADVKRKTSLPRSKVIIKELIEIKKEQSE